jgi:hypothetical protein
MSDYRNPDFDPFDPNDPYRRDPKLNPDLRPSNVVTGWVVAAVFAAAILSVIFGLTRQPAQVGTNTASNDTPPVISHMTPPAGTAQTAPSLQTTPKPPISPVKPAPAPPSGNQ